MVMVFFAVLSSIAALADENKPAVIEKGVLNSFNDIIGAVVAFAGPEKNIPSGYMLCDGRALSSKDFAMLYQRIGQYWGDGKTGMGVGDTTDFNIPDLRGMFLRGVTYDREDEYKDPDSTQRKAGSEEWKNEVGSSQVYATALPRTTNRPFKTKDGEGRHKHKIRDGKGDGDGDYLDSVPNRNTQERYITVDDGMHQHTITGGGDSETRPNNAYVNFIIRVK